MKFIFHIMPGLLLAVLASCSNHSDYKFEEGMAWNTIYHITYDSNKDLSDSVIVILNEIDNSLSPFNENSVVSNINSNSDSIVDRHFISVYNESTKIQKETDGMFDPTLGPIIRAWGFGQGHRISSDTLHIDSLLYLVGLQKTKLTENKIIKSDPRIEFNFSALAKGYGVDCIAEMFQRNSVENFLIEIGGEIRVKGVNPEGKNWTIGIDTPNDHNPGSEIIETISVDNAGIATSGNYRNYQNSGKRQFGHTISPISGQPIETDVISATVIAPTCMEADALATSCMALGAEEALNLCTRMRAGVMLITKEMNVITNAAFKAACK